MVFANYPQMARHKLQLLHQIQSIMCWYLLIIRCDLYLSVWRLFLNRNFHHNLDLKNLLKKYLFFFDKLCEIAVMIEESMPPDDRKQPSGASDIKKFVRQTWLTKHLVFLSNIFLNP